MKTKIIIVSSILFIFLFNISVLAEEEFIKNNNIEISHDSLEPQGLFSSLFSFITIPDTVCHKRDSFFTPYKGFVRPTGVTVTKYGKLCQPGELINLFACINQGIDPSAPDYNAVYTYCNDIFAKWYEKESNEDRLNLLVECDGESCFDTQWFVTATEGKYIGYECRDCEASLEGCDLLESFVELENCLSYKGGICTFQYGGFNPVTDTGFYYCNDGNVYVADNIVDGFKEYYCVINGENINPSFTPCSENCMDGSCVDLMCLPNTKWCEGQEIWSCNDDGTELSKVKTCDSSKICKEQASTAFCEPLKWFYCVNDNYNCIKRDIGGINCYDIPEDCASNIPVYCLSVGKSKCILRSGECEEGELMFKGTDAKSVFNTCKNQIVNPMLCFDDKDCDDNDNCTTDKCVKKLLSKECENTYIENCDKKIDCEENTFLGIHIYQWKQSEEKTGGYLCFLGIGCTIRDTSKCGIANWVIITLITSIISIMVIIAIILFKKDDSGGF